MKKHISSSEKYRGIKQKNTKKYTPNLPSTDDANLEAYEKMRSFKEMNEVNPVTWDGFDSTANLNTNTNNTGEWWEDDIFKNINNDWQLKGKINSSERVKHDPTKKLSLIVPYRNREKHLKEFLKRVPPYLDQQNIDYKITVVEQQNDNKQFNKGVLNNVGFLETQDCDYFCFHDVDMIPIGADYGYAINKNVFFGMVIHLAKFVEQFNFQDLPGYFGGVILVDKLAYNLVNGYSINYWGWGVEDNDFGRRCHMNSKVITVYRNGYYNSLPHEHNFNQNMYRNNFGVYSKNLNHNEDGLLQTRYNIVSKSKLTDKASMITISIP